MSPRKFDRFMVDVEISGNPKIGRLTDAEFRCLVSGVWALAAKANPRGFLLVGPLPAGPEDVARQAHCSVSVARRTLAKLRELEMLETDEPSGWQWVHDWDELNPAPKPSDQPVRTRDRKRRSRASHANVTRDTKDCHAPEVEVEVEEKNFPPNPPQAGGVCPAPLIGGRHRDRERRETEIAAFAAEHFPDQPVGLVRHWASQLRNAGHEPTVDLIRLQLQHPGGVAA